MPQKVPTLKQFLSRWTYYSVPDYYYEAWRILFHGAKYANKSEILNLARKDMLEEDHLRRLDALPPPEIEDLGYYPWNW